LKFGDFSIFRLIGPSKKTQPASRGSTRASSAMRRAREFDRGLAIKIFR
jgi:hypothetical protein